MVLLHLVRCQRFLWRGLCDRAQVSKSIHGHTPLPTTDSPTAVVPARAVRRVAALLKGNSGSSSSGTTAVPAFVWPWSRTLPHDPAFGHFIGQPITTPVYCGLRMVDELGHVNNAKYLEISEFARWHQLAFLGLGNVMAARKVAFVVSDLSITYIREIAPCKTVWVRTRMLLPAAPPGAPNADSAVAPAAAAAAAASRDKKRFFVEHELWSADGQKLHAALTLAAALVGPVEYERELQARYGQAEPVEAARGGGTGTAKPPRARTTLDCEHVLADAAGFTTIAEVRAAFAAVEHVCTPTPDEASAAASTPAEPRQVAPPTDEGRAVRIRTLAQVWRTWRSELRHKSLLPRPVK